jgi:hypothetical protein
VHEPFLPSVCSHKAHANKQKFIIISKIHESMFGDENLSSASFHLGVEIKLLTRLTEKASSRRLRMRDGKFQEEKR